MLRAVKYYGGGRKKKNLTTFLSNVHSKLLTKRNVTFIIEGLLSLVPASSLTLVCEHLH